MKIVERGALDALLQELRRQKKSIVFTNGCFDILHVGHVRYLQAARKLGDVLVLGLNSDTSVQALKGPTRPINSQADRAEVLAGLEAVDHIVIFDEITAERVVAAVKPDIYAKGGDYLAEDLPEAKIVREYGGQVVLLPEVKGRSSSKMIERIRDRQRE
ncbi:MAG: D-glycero-beta-D-manno-heptose 1-phosphate adenylyltransferase [Bacillota bacterium]